MANYKKMYLTLFSGICVALEQMQSEFKNEDIKTILSASLLEAERIYIEGDEKVISLNKIADEKEKSC